MWALCMAALVLISITHWVYRWRNPKCNGELPPGSMGLPLLGESLQFFTPTTSSDIPPFIKKRMQRWRNPKCNGELPPGSMGLPLLGESLQFFTPTTSSDIPPFIKKRMQRYGPIFKTSLVGRQLIVSTDPDFNHFIFQQDDKLFLSWYPDTFTEVMGKENMGTLHGYIHKYVKNMVFDLVGPESLKRMLPEIEQEMEKKLQQWSCQDITELKDECANLIFDMNAKKLISYDSKTSSDNLRENFDEFIRGLISFPLGIPGTAYHKCLQGRKRAMRVLQNLLQERRGKSRQQPIDFFDYLIEETDKEGTFMTDEISLDLIFVLLFASFETTSTAITLAVKLLSDHPRALKQLAEEHEMILKERENSESGLAWKEYKSMTFTLQFINETIRLANIVPGIFRKAARDINYKGYTIPAGWGVMVCPPAVHMNPQTYDDPLAFNPWRWEGMQIHTASRNFMAFGGGMRFCAGADSAKVQMAVFLHCLVTKYRWEAIRGGNIVRTPGLQFPEGFHIRMQEKDSSNWKQPISLET